MQNLYCRFDRYYIRQIYGGDFAKFCGLLRIYELYQCKNYTSQNDSVTHTSPSPAVPYLLLLFIYLVQSTLYEACQGLVKTVMPHNFSGPCKAEWNTIGVSFKKRPYYAIISFCILSVHRLEGSVNLQQTKFCQNADFWTAYLASHVKRGY